MDQLTIGNGMTKTTLNPELQAYVRDEGWCQGLSHPLVRLFPFDDRFTSYANEMLTKKRQALREAEAEGDWVRFLMMYEKFYRMDAFIEISSRLNDEDYWRLLGETWMEIETCYQYRRHLPRLFNPPKRSLEHRHLLMTEDEKAVLQSMPETVTIYRGCGSLNRKGWSWTPDMEQAEWFSERFDDHRFGGLILVGQCQRSEIIAFFNRRQENELIIDPRHVKIVETIMVSGEDGEDEE